MRKEQSKSGSGEGRHAPGGTAATGRPRIRFTLPNTPLQEGGGRPRSELAAAHMKARRLGGASLSSTHKRGNVGGGGAHRLGRPW
jgi:hypothetical protein